MVSLAAWRGIGFDRSWVEPVGPSPARDEIGFFGLEGGGDGFDMAFRVCSGGSDVVVAGDPGEVKRNERAEQMSAVDGAEPVGQKKVKDDASPQAVGHAERGSVGG